MDRLSPDTNAKPRQSEADHRPEAHHPEMEGHAPPEQMPKRAAKQEDAQHQNGQQRNHHKAYDTACPRCQRWRGQNGCRRPVPWLDGTHLRYRLSAENRVCRATPLPGVKSTVALHHARGIHEQAYIHGVELVIYIGTVADKTA